jgi:hypothetical protein
MKVPFIDIKLHYNTILYPNINEILKLTIIIPCFLKNKYL